MVHSPRMQGHYDPRTGYTIIDVQETDEGPRPGTAIKPIPETYAGQNFPYRGTETHGVDPIYDVEPPPEQWEGGMVPVSVAEPEEPQKVIPVRIVEESSEEYDDWATGQADIGVNPTQIVGRNPRRSSLKIRNLSATVVVYVGKDMGGANFFSGWPIDPGDSLDLNSTEAVFGRAVTGTVIVAILQEFTVG